ncbi:MFS transporter [Saccharopolyspora sp. HNM0983]|uniref:MFS transporter n=1 Tax=Saccharopolyspora montiporae TaxID=2781240 RepID=A0A929G2K0_9PSEU|nr:MFS transporter [Saccharopolyspora sp. HNM0983]
MTADRSARRAWWIWSVAVVAYVAAVFHRGSLGVAGPLALDRFAVGPAALSAFTVLQVGIYASMQVPTGLLVDRFGARRILTLAVLLLGTGQVLFAVATSYPFGLLGRAVLGTGDALMWVSLLRLVATGFSARRYALVATTSSALGALGGVAATFPLAAVLDRIGWVPTFLAAGLGTLAYAALTAAFVREGAAPRADRGRRPPLRSQVRAAWARPSTRLAFWVHFATMFASGALSLLWGYPYLVDGLGMAEGTAGVVLSVLIIGQVVGGPVVGALAGSRPAARIPLVLGYLTANAGCWLVLLTWSPAPPIGIVVAAFAVFAFGGPVSTVAFAIVREHAPAEGVGTATGIVNAAGHSATALGALGVGVLLELAAGLEPADRYRAAMLALVALLLVGAWRTIRWTRRVSGATGAVTLLRRRPLPPADHSTVDRCQGTNSSSP